MSAYKLVIYMHGAGGDTVKEKEMIIAVPPSGTCYLGNKGYAK